jgi:hypothetical protein
MPFSFHVDDCAGILHIQAIGDVNDADLMGLYDRLHDEVAFVAQYPIVCDGSTLNSVSVSSGLIESLAECARSRSNLLLIVAPMAVAYGLARMYQLFTDPEDRRIHVFTQVEEAMAWLGTHRSGHVLAAPIMS